MSKYDALSRYLGERRGPIEVTFAEVENILGFPLPASARRYPAWWSNSGGTHVQAESWMASGYRTENVDVASARVRFVPIQPGEGFGEMKQASFEADKAAPPHITKEAEGAKRHPAFGIWKGLVTLDPDYDYTQPADPDWGKVYEQ